MAVAVVTVAGAIAVAVAAAAIFIQKLEKHAAAVTNSGDEQHAVAKEATAAEAAGVALQ